jgi:hypothetical protein
MARTSRKRSESGSSKRYGENVVPASIAAQQMLALRLARLLLTEDPSVIELAATNSHLLAQLERGSVVVRVTEASGNVGYIAMEGGTPFTTTTLPASATPDNIRDVVRPTRHLVLDHFKRIIKACKPNPDASPPRILGRALRTIADFYADANRAELKEYALLSDRVFRNTRRPDLESASDSAISDWLGAVWADLTAAHAYLEVHTHVLAPWIATIQLLSLGQRPLRSTIAVGIPQAMEALAREMRGSAHPARVLPVFHPEPYLQHVLDKREARRWAVDSARRLQADADKLRQEALGQWALNQMNGRLYSALLLYRAAQVLYWYALKGESMGTQEATSDPSLETASGEWRACEESRAVILASLTHASYPGDSFGSGGPPDFFNLAQFRQWLGRLASTKPHEANRVIYDAELQLLMPVPLRRLAVASLTALTSGAVQDLEMIANEMQHRLLAGELGAEPDYLSGTFDLIASALQQHGRIHESATYRERATRIRERTDRRQATIPLQ